MVSNRFKPGALYEGAQVFFQTGKRKSNYEDNLHKSVWAPVDFSVFDDYIGKPSLDHLDRRKSKSPLHAWGAGLNEKNENLKRYKQMREDDFLFLFLAQKLIAGLRIRLTWREPALSLGIWDTADWPLVYALDNLVRYDIPKDDCLEALKYAPGSIRGLMRAKASVELEPFMNLLKEQGGIP